VCKKKVYCSEQLGNGEAFGVRWLDTAFPDTFILSDCRGKLRQAAALQKLKPVRPIRLFLLLLLFVSITFAQTSERVSSFREYKGYSQEVYKEWQRSSVYITTRDGTRLAADIIRPTVNGKPTEEKLPVIWTHNRYHRALYFNGNLRTIIDNFGWLTTMLKHGYVVVSVDVRGSGASFGTYDGPFSEKESQDAYDVTEWLAKQDWSNGKIGMFGVSYLAITQYMAASQKPPHLKAIIPEKAMFDFYSFGYPGGIFRQDFTFSWSNLTKSLSFLAPAPPVDEDKDGSLFKAAQKEHRNNRDVYEMGKASPYRNSIDPVSKRKLNITRSPSTYLKEINESGIAIYTIGGWFDLWPRDALLWFANLKTPQRLMIGPWFHQMSIEEYNPNERLRWFDYWLKGIDNGITKEPRIWYYTINAPDGKEWRSTDAWPLPNQKETKFYFQGGNATVRERVEESQSVPSINDGTLTTAVPKSKNAFDAYKVDYTTTSGKPSRWSNGYGLGGARLRYANLSENDKKALAYTTESLSDDMEVTGHPIAHLWISSTAKDGDFFVYLEDIDEQGVSHYVTEGALRASHRKLSQAPFNNLGLPYHRSYIEDILKLNGKPVELIFDLHPTSYIFKKDHRIRVTITCADKDNTQTPELKPAPTVKIYRDASKASYIVLPVIMKW
jgi:putative CocE/NonD family hydrolase